jgi:transcriptional regulator with XRE-family HTH domain
MGIGYLLKEERLRNNLSQDDVARAIGSTKQAIYKYENEIVTNIPLDKIEIMARLFGVTPAYLMGWSEEKENSPEEPKLTEGEKEWLDLYRSLPEASRLQLSRSLKAFEMLPEHLQTVALQEFALQMLQAKLNDQ